MSYSLKYYPDPGIAFDISKMLFVKLNPESVWKESLTTLDSPIDEVKFIHKHADSFPTPDPILLLFSFKLINRNGTFISEIITNLFYQNFTNFSIHSLLNYLNNDSIIQKDLYTYYLGESDYSFTNLERIIQTSKLLPDRIKLLLFGFILNPSRYTARLCETIQNYYRIFEVSYSSLSLNITLPSLFIDTIIKNTYSPQKQLSLNIHSKSISYSLSFTMPYFLFRNFVVEEPFLITTQFSIKHLFTKDATPYTSALLSKVSALNDKYRITIIDQLLLYQSMTLQELSHAIGLSLSATNHHLTLLKKANMISSVRHSHSVRYSFNPEGFQDTIKLLQKLEKGVTES